MPGYFIEPRVLADFECDALIGALSNEKRGRAGMRHLMGHPAVALLAVDARLLVIARRFMGPQAVPFRATLFEKTSSKNWLIAWHQDTALPIAARVDQPGWGPWTEKAGIIYAHAPSSALARIIALRVHLDASTVDNGPLRVIPGSHSDGVLNGEQIFERARANVPVDCTVPRGGILAMRPLIIHASSKARSENPRRVLHIEYAGCLDLAPGIRLAIA